jgi:putative ABC transport system permease protein
MITYYLRSATKSLFRNRILTALIIVAIAFGIGASMTVFSVFRTMSGDPIPWKSAQLFVPRIDTRPPDKRRDGVPDLLSYQDVMALRRAKIVARQTPLYTLALHLIPEDINLLPLHVVGVAVDRDFFHLFDVPFRYGSPWTVESGDDRSDVVVIGKRLNDRLFAGKDAVGQSLNLDGTHYRVVGVIQDWNPQPRLYNLLNSPYGDSEDFFIPFNTAVEHKIAPRGFTSCSNAWSERLGAVCTWILFWVEATTPSDAQHYRDFLANYSLEQQRLGRFSWLPSASLSNARDWLEEKNIVPTETRLSLILAFGFLTVCLVNGVVLMMAKFLSRNRETAIRRALGATRRDVFSQFLVEAGVIGALAGLLGLGLTAVGLAIEKSMLPQEMARVTALSPAVIGMTFGLAVFATVCAGLYPSWRGSIVEPAVQSKT